MENSDLETLNRFRDDVIATFAGISLEIEAIQKAMVMDGTLGSFRLPKARDQVNDSLANMKEHYSKLIAPLYKR
jgi:hypothetical protein